MERIGGALPGAGEGRGVSSRAICRCLLILWDRFSHRIVCDYRTRVGELRALLLKAVDFLGRGEVDRCFAQGEGRLDFVSFGRVISLALGDEKPDDDGIADMFGLVVSTHAICRCL